MNATRVLVRDELIGFARSKVMIVLWIVLPVIAMAGFLLLPIEAMRTANRSVMSATTFMSVIISSLAGTIAALMIAVDLVSERNRNVFVLFAIRPIRREAIVWSKFIAVFGCVGVACVVSLLLGIVVDAIRGVPVTADALHDAARGLAAATAAVALSAAVGALFGVLARSVVVAVILVLYVGQNLAVVPMVPIYFGWLPNSFWITFVISGVLVAVVLWIAGVLFRRAQL